MLCSQNDFSLISLHLHTMTLYSHSRSPSCLTPSLCMLVRAEKLLTQRTAYYCHGAPIMLSTNRCHSATGSRSFGRRAMM